MLHSIMQAVLKCEANQQKLLHFFLTTDSSDHTQMTATQGLAQENK